MNKKETVYVINKLITQYKKRKQNCSEQILTMKSEDYEMLNEDFIQLEMIENEEVLMDEFTSDLIDLLNEIKGK